MNQNIGKKNRNFFRIFAYFAKRKIFKMTYVCYQYQYKSINIKISGTGPNKHYSMYFMTIKGVHDNWHTFENREI